MRRLHEERCEAIALLEAGRTVNEVAQQIGRSSQWVRKWKRRFAAAGYAGLKERSRAPKKPGRQMPVSVREAVIRVRMQLESQAQNGLGLKYIGGRAVRTQLKKQGCQPLPSVPTIERILREAGLTKQRAERMEVKIDYPHLQPKQPHELLQVDIVPHYLEGGERVACFNALDVVSRYPTGEAYSQRRSLDASAFLIHTWQTMGIPRYTQVDNEGCFSGGATHSCVLGRIVRLALSVGTELVFSPTYHPESNGYVERFHQEYNRHVWEETYLSDLADVNQKGQNFFEAYRHSGHHSRLDGWTPYEFHLEQAPNRLAHDFKLPESRQPLVTGRVHFIRRVQGEASVRVLNKDWAVPANPDTGVWVTLDIQTDAAYIRVYDAAPDATDRRCLIVHPFTLQESVILQDEVTLDSSVPEPPDAIAHSQPVENAAQTQVTADTSIADVFLSAGLRLFQNTLIRTLEITDQLLE